MVGHMRKNILMWNGQTWLNVESFQHMLDIRHNLFMSKDYGRKVPWGNLIDFGGYTRYKSEFDGSKRRSFHGVGVWSPSSLLL